MTLLPHSAMHCNVQQMDCLEIAKKKNVLYVQVIINNYCVGPGSRRDPKQQT